MLSQEERPCPLKFCTLSVFIRLRQVVVWGMNCRFASMLVQCRFSCPKQFQNSWPSMFIPSWSAEKNQKHLHLSFSEMSGLVGSYTKPGKQYIQQLKECHMDQSPSVWDTAPCSRLSGEFSTLGLSTGEALVAVIVELSQAGGFDNSVLPPKTLKNCWCTTQNSQSAHCTLSWHARNRPQHGHWNVMGSALQRPLAQICWVPQPEMTVKGTGVCWMVVEELRPCLECFRRTVACQERKSACRHVTPTPYAVGRKTWEGNMFRPSRERQYWNTSLPSLPLGFQDFRPAARIQNPKP